MTPIGSPRHGLDEVFRSDDMHPTVRVRASSWVTQSDGSRVHFSGYRQATIRQAIELEAEPNPQWRPSWRMDERSLSEKVRQWLQMLMARPTDALTLVRINRHPPMVSWQYDDSDDWGGKRWRRALAVHRHENWCTRKVKVVAENAPTNQVQPDFIPRFLLKTKQGLTPSSSSGDDGPPARTYNTSL